MSTTGRGSSDQPPPRVWVAAATADRPWADRVAALLDIPAGPPSIVDDAEIIVFVVSYAVTQDAWLLDKMSKALSSGRRVIPVATVGGLAEHSAFAFVRDLHWILASSLDDATLKQIIQRAVWLAPGTAAALGELVSMALRWDRLGRRVRDLLPVRRLRDAGQVWASVTDDRASFGGPVVSDLLAASRQRMQLRRRRRMVIAAGMAVAVALAGVYVGVGYMQERTASSRTQAAQLEQLSVDAASRAAAALSSGDERLALDHALVALEAASTRYAREVSRQVLSVPLPQTTFVVADLGVSAVAWSQTGRYLAVASSAGNVWLLDTVSRSLLEAWHTEWGAIASVRFVKSGSRAVIESRSEKGTQQHSTDLSALDGEEPDAPIRGPSDVSADGAAEARVTNGGVLLATRRCRSDLNGSCTTWLPPTAGEVVAARWHPTASTLAVVTSGGHVGLVDASHPLRKSTAVIEDAAHPTEDQGWAGYLTDERKTIIVTAGAARLVSGLTVPSTTTNLTCLRRSVRTPGDVKSGPATRFDGVDCRGVVAWSVDVDTVTEALPGKSLQPTPRSLDRPVVANPRLEVAPTGTSAVAIDNSGTAFFLRRSQEWTVTHTADARIDQDVEVKGVAFADDGTAAAVALGPLRESQITNIVSFVDSGAPPVVYVGQIQAGSLAALSTGRRTIALGDSAIGSVEPILLLDPSANRLVMIGHGGAPIAFDATGSYMLAVGGDPIAIRWPSSYGGLGVQPRFARLYDATSGEMLCQAVFFQPSQPIAFVAPDLSSLVIHSYERPLLQHTCSPLTETLATIVRQRLASFVPVRMPH